MRAAGPAPGGASGPVAAAQLPRRGRARGVRRARPSFVDESLFGSPAGARPAPPGFAPPWAAAAARPGSAPPFPRAGLGGPRAALGRVWGCNSTSLHGLRSHTPSFCDESLFGAKPEGPAWAAPWMKKEDVAKLHPLLWSPPPAPRNQPSPSPPSRETPLRAVHPRAPSCLWKRPDGDSCSAGRDAPCRGRSQSLSRLSTPSDRLCLPSDNLKTERCKNQSTPTAPVTLRRPLMRGRSTSVSGPPLARSSAAVGGCKPRPPWK
uniref:RBPJ-interacting and tubulin-associated protein 1 n=1 Tax=Strix occidentalis caurina TaxID=311401 RepID=A0A8D0EHK1_STROC